MRQEGLEDLVQESLISRSIGEVRRIMPEVTEASGLLQAPQMTVQELLVSPVSPENSYRFQIQNVITNISEELEVVRHL